jgi:hypothetical protein
MEHSIRGIGWTLHYRETLHELFVARPGCRPSLRFQHVRSNRKTRPGASMTDRNRSFGAALWIVVALIAAAALAAMLAP